MAILESCNRNLQKNNGQGKSSIKKISTVSKKLGCPCLLL